MSKTKYSLIASIAILSILFVLFLSGARMASASFQTTDGGLPFVSAVLHSGSATPPSSGENEFSGAVQTTGNDSWTIAGIAVQIRPDTEIKGNFTTGDQVKVHVFQDANGLLIALEISPLSAEKIDPTGENANSNEGTTDDNSNSSISEDNGNSNEANENESIGNSNTNDDAKDNSDDDHGNNSNENSSHDDHGDDHGNGNGNWNTNESEHD